MCPPSPTCCWRPCRRRRGTAGRRSRRCWRMTSRGGGGGRWAPGGCGGAAGGARGGGLSPGRRGVVQLDPGALRRLDRVSAVVIDSAVLCDGELRLLSAVSTGDVLDDAGVWRAAGALLAGYGRLDLEGPGPWLGGGRDTAGYRL